jgi:hypothetical protein
MTEVTIHDLKQMASDAREAIWQSAEEVVRTPKIYLHWTAGHYQQPFEDYHVNITGDGKILVPSTDLSVYRSHTYRRNSGSIGISLCCCYNATSKDLGPEPPTTKQIEVMAQVIAAIADGLWLTIDKNYVLTHSEAADNEDGLNCHEDYGPMNGCERWDLEYLGTDESPRFRPSATDGSRGGDVLRGKANWYRNEWKKG